tara:strand:+ start:260 stop:589 length:330 start_codon:yes stop_codon:yes gene_type:complete
MKKIVILLITITSLFGQLKWGVDSSVVRQLYVLDENYIKHYPNQIEWKTENQKLFIYVMQSTMRKVRKGSYNQKRSQEIADVIQRYVEIEKQHREDLKSLKKELRKLTK